MRYSRQELILGKESQKKLKNSCIAVIGLGALGSLSAELLTRAGIGKLILVDRDIVELTNLQRQHLFTEADIGKEKVMVAKKYLQKINSDIKIKSYFDNLNKDNIDLIKSDLVLDCTDNLETRFLINDYCKKNKIPWIYASCIKDHGYIFNIINKPCFRCLVKNITSLETCATSGILNTISTIIASIQVNESIKILLNKNYEKNLIYFNITKNTLEKIKVKPDLNCPTCNNNYEFLYKKQPLVKLCGSQTYLIKGNYDFNTLQKSLKEIKDIKLLTNAFMFDNVTVFKSGNVLIKVDSEKQAKIVYSKYIGT